MVVDGKIILSPSRHPTRFARGRTLAQVASAREDREFAKKTILQGRVHPTRFARGRNHRANRPDLFLY